MRRRGARWEGKARDTEAHGKGQRLAMERLEMARTEDGHRRTGASSMRRYCYGIVSYWSAGDSTLRDSRCGFQQQQQQQQQAWPGAGAPGNCCPSRFISCEYGIPRYSKRRKLFSALSPL